MPFFAEEMYHNLKTDKMPESVHLCDWPKTKDEGHADLELENKMDEVRKIVNLALAERSAKSIKVRQPLSLLKIKKQKESVKSEIQEDEELINLIEDEVNVKKIIFDAKIENEIEFDTTITQELKEEGIIRDLTRCIQNMRKEAGLKPENKILVSFSNEAIISNILEKNKEFILKEINANDFYPEKKSEAEFIGQKEIEIDQQKILLKIKNI